MKKLALLLCTSLVVVLTTHAQETEEKNERPKNGVSIGVMGGGELKNAGLALPGVGYKRYFKNGGIRLVLGGRIDGESQTDMGITRVTQTGMFSARLGYQYHVTIKNFMPVIGMDGLGGYYLDEYRSTNGEDYLTENTVFGISPNAGIVVWLHPKLSVSLETRFDLTYRQNKTKETSYEWSSSKTVVLVTNSSNANGFKTHIAPISLLMFSLHF